MEWMAMAAIYVPRAFILEPLIPGTPGRGSQLV